MLDNDFITSLEADSILYSGEIQIDPDHYLEVLDKIYKKKQE